MVYSKMLYFLLPQYFATPISGKGGGGNEKVFAADLQYPGLGTQCALSHLIYKITL